MICSQRQKMVAITPPQAIVDDASWTTTEVDTYGYDYCTIYVLLGATDIAMTALTVTESDTAGSGHASVTGLVFGTSTNTDGSTSTLPSATDDNKFFAFEIDMRGRKRYLDLTATIGNGSLGGYLVAWAVLERAESGPNSATERGCSQILRVP